nr:hypothetical protein [uncultured Capnocytophaga sp.]
MQNPISIYTKVRSSSAEINFHLSKVPCLDTELYFHLYKSTFQQYRNTISFIKSTFRNFRTEPNHTKITHRSTIQKTKSIQTTLQIQEIEITGFIKFI